MTTRHPTPATMARLTSALPANGVVVDYHSGFAAGAAAERARVAAWLMVEAKAALGDHGLLVARLAFELNGKVEP